MLLIGAGLLIRSFARLQRVQPGFDPSALLVTDVPLSPRAYAKPVQRTEFFDRIIERARNLPGVMSAGAAAVLPVTGRGTVIHFNIQGRPPKTPSDYILIGLRPVSPGCLETLHVPLIAGRLLRDSDTERSPFVAVVNESMARQYFPGQSPLGKMVQLGAEPDNQIPWMRIVGVVGDVKQSLATEAASEMYVPYRQSDTLLPVFTMSLVLRTAGNPRSEVSAVRSAAHELDPNQPLVNFRTMQENVATSVSDPRFRTTLLGIFAGSAVLLAMIGLYGLMAYSVAQRTSEIGIRLALGAQRGDMMKMIVVNGLKLVLIGVGIGVVGAFALSQSTETVPLRRGADRSSDVRDRVGPANRCRRRGLLCSGATSYGRRSAGGAEARMMRRCERFFVEARRARSAHDERKSAFVAATSASEYTKREGPHAQRRAWGALKATVALRG